MVKIMSATCPNTRSLTYPKTILFVNILQCGFDEKCNMSRLQYFAVIWSPSVQWLVEIKAEW